MRKTHSFNPTYIYTYRIEEVADAHLEPQTHVEEAEEVGEPVEVNMEALIDARRRAVSAGFDPDLIF